MWFTNHRVKYIEDIVDLWTFLGDADSEIMGSPDSARHTECNSMCLCTWIWWVTLRWSTFSFSSLFFSSFCIYAHHIPSLFKFFCILCLISPHFGFTPLFISPVFLLLFLLLLLCLPLCPCLICLLFPVLLFFLLPLMFSLLTDLQRRQKQR